MSDVELIQIGQVAEKVGVTVRTVRYYEERGLLHPNTRTEGGIRLYGEHDVVRLRFIRRLTALGVSLAEIGALLGNTDAIEGSRERVAHTLTLLQMEHELIAKELEALTRLDQEVEEALASVQVCAQCGADVCPESCPRRAFLL